LSKSFKLINMSLTFLYWFGSHSTATSRSIASVKAIYLKEGAKKVGGGGREGAKTRDSQEREKKSAKAIKLFFSFFL